MVQIPKVPVLNINDPQEMKLVGYGLEHHGAVIVDGLDSVESNGFSTTIEEFFTDERRRELPNNGKPYLTHPFKRGYGQQRESLKFVTCEDVGTLLNLFPDLAKLIEDELRSSQRTGRIILDNIATYLGGEATFAEGLGILELFGYPSTDKLPSPGLALTSHIDEQTVLARNACNLEVKIGKSWYKIILESDEGLLMPGKDLAANSQGRIQPLRHRLTTSETYRCSALYSFWTPIGYRTTELTSPTS